MAVLSEQERVFCRLIAVEGIKQGAAYAQVFGVKANSAATMAGRLLKRVEIQDEIERLSTRKRQVAEAAALWSREEKQERLQRVFELSVSEGKFSEAISAIRELNRMDGDYREAESQTNVQVNVGLSVGDVVRSVMGAS